MNKLKIGYWVVTVLFSLMVLMSSGMYILNHEHILEAFSLLGYPTYIIYPLAVAKFLGVIAIVSKKSQFLKNMAYAGFFYNFVLAFFAHAMVHDGQQVGALMAMVLMLCSFFTERKLNQTD
jgi:hypothetical protein